IARLPPTPDSSSSRSRCASLSASVRRSTVASPKASCSAASTVWKTFCAATGAASRSEQRIPRSMVVTGSEDVAEQQVEAIVLALEGLPVGLDDDLRDRPPVQAEGQDLGVVAGDRRHAGRELRLRVDLLVADEGVQRLARLRRELGEQVVAGLDVPAV